MIYLKTPSQITKIEYANEVGSEVLKLCRKYIKPGIATIELEYIAEKYCMDNNVRPSFKGYKDYPYCLCISVNEEIVHGFPSERIIKSGDIVSVDFGVEIDGYYSDAAFTKIVGKVSNRVRKLVKTTKKCMYAGINKACNNNKLFDISLAIQEMAESSGFNVVRVFGGHGVGFDVHEAPFITNFVPTRASNYKLKTGMVLAIEPMLVEGSCDVEISSNSWTALTKDKKMSAHFERSIAITDDGPLIMADF